MERYIIEIEINAKNYSEAEDIADNKLQLVNLSTLGRSIAVGRVYKKKI